ncbi:MAG: site-specific integrase [Candidatus Sumerlaeota bacterium]|nr:site-specific integrase [Candidatus Sumerlaeota bacterium]
MRLYKRENRKGPASWVIDYCLNGQRRRKVLKGVTTRKLAEAAFGEFRMKYERGQVGVATNPNLTLGECLQAYLDSKRAHCVPSYFDTLTARKKQAGGFLGENAAVQSITHKNISEFVSFLKSEGDSPATINKKITLLKAAGALAVKTKQITTNPFADVERVSDPRPPAWRWLTHDDVNRLLDVCQHGARIKVKRENKRNYELDVPAPHGLYPIVIFLLNTGARRGEAIKLTWADVDAGRGLVRLVATKKAARGRRAEARFIPLNATLKELFEGMERGAAADRVFAVSWNNLRRKFGKACKMAGLGHCRIHDLRHTFASHLAINGTPLTVIRELMGHETMTMTLRYAHLCPSTKVSAVDGLNLGGAKAEAKVIVLGEKAG